jgi:hypothetical protein
MIVVSLPLCALVLYHTRDTNLDVEHVIHIEDLTAEKVEGISVPKGHHAENAEHDD